MSLAGVRLAVLDLDRDQACPADALGELAVVLGASASGLWGLPRASELLFQVFSTDEPRYSDIVSMASNADGFA